MRSLLRPASIQLFTICRGFGFLAGFSLFAEFFTGTTSLVLFPGVGTFRRNPYASDRVTSFNSVRMNLFQTLKLFATRSLGLSCKPLGSI